MEKFWATEEYLTWQAQDWRLASPKFLLIVTILSVLRSLLLALLEYTISENRYFILWFMSFVSKRKGNDGGHDIYPKEFLWCSLEYSLFWCIFPIRKLRLEHGLSRSLFVRTVYVFVSPFVKVFCNLNDQIQRASTSFVASEVYLDFFSLFCRLSLICSFLRAFLLSVAASFWSAKSKLKDVDSHKLLAFSFHDLG